ncbi:hypothetical protein ZHAS_00002408 [Anopheles sinensis]|uniref:Uncharacterized protein n=1 Tax=Anopheles sinensis TaxID=74873 RepID=A0A084VC75_ANOSI|nr:hypothetical protein ZHAS_00002408 [Anopheles sinensis]
MAQRNKRGGRQPRILARNRAPTQRTAMSRYRVATKIDGKRPTPAPRSKVQFQWAASSPVWRCPCDRPPSYRSSKGPILRIPAANDATGNRHRST